MSLSLIANEERPVHLVSRDGSVIFTDIHIYWNAIKKAKEKERQRKHRMELDKKSHKMEMRQYMSKTGLFAQIQRCQKNNDVQQVVYSTYHDAVTQVCFTCGMIRTTMTDADIRFKTGVTHYEVIT